MFLPLASFVFFLEKELGVLQDRRPPCSSSASFHWDWSAQHLWAHCASIQNMPCIKHPAAGHSCTHLCILGRHSFLRSFIRFQRLRSWCTASLGDWKFSVVLLLQTEVWWSTCYRSGVTDPELQILPMVQQRGVTWGMLGNSSEGNHYRNAKIILFTTAAKKLQHSQGRLGSGNSEWRPPSSCSEISACSWNGMAVAAAHCINFTS